MKDMLTILICSCDKYQDLWELNINLLNKYWPDDKMDICLLTDCETQREFKNVKVFSAGKNLEYSDRIKAILPNIKTEFILLTLDDYFLKKEVRLDEFKELIYSMKIEKIDYIRLYKHPRERRKIKSSFNKNLIEINLDSSYKVNLYPGIWRKSFLEKTLNISLNAWDYEVSLTNISKKLNAKCYMTNGNEFKFLDVIRKGKILNGAYLYLLMHKLPSLNRSRISILTELKLGMLLAIKEVLPLWLFAHLKRVMIKLGFRFISGI